MPVTRFPISRNKRTTIAARGLSLLTAAVFAVGVGAPVVVAAPDQLPAVTTMTREQNVDWMSSDTAAYLGSIGMDVMVPAWVPSPFEGVAPDVYAGDGSYSLYWMAPGGTPTFLHITGVVGGAFPDGSKADLNVPLSVNTSVQGWPAIQDIGIPAGSSTPIYDQVWWIANGVRYSVESNNIGTDSLTLANSMIYLQAPPPPTEVPTEEVVPTEEPYVPPTEAPAPPTSIPPTDEPPTLAPPTSAPPTDVPAIIEEPVETVVVDEPNTESVSEETVAGQPETEPETSGNGTTSSDGTGGAANVDDARGWAPSRFDGDVPSDGTSGPRPPVIGGDGTGGLFDTALPRIIIRP
jgi:hypothetical protein